MMNKRLVMEGAKIVATAAVLGAGTITTVAVGSTVAKKITRTVRTAAQHRKRKGENIEEPVIDVPVVDHEDSTEKED